MENYCILFAGPRGSGKTTIASYLGAKLGLPIFSNDFIREEVTAELHKLDEAEYQKRRTIQLDGMLKSGKSFIYDASVDRRWEELKSLLLKNNYKTFIISLDFSKQQLQEIYQIKYGTNLDEFERTFADHQKFLKRFHKDVALSLKDEQFLNSRESALSGIKKHIGILD